MASSARMTDLGHVAQAARERFAMSLDGIHGMAHWQRARANGLRIAHHTGASELIVELFAYLHDCCREDDGTDPGHGARAAQFAESLRGKVLHLSDDEFALLHHAIRDHELGRTRADMTVMTCWDADRLDLGRVGIYPDPAYLCTDHARQKDTIQWAYQRSLRDRD